MKTLLSIVVAALIVHACVRAGDSAWRFYRFEDAVDQEARFGTATTTSQLRGRLMEIAADHGVDLTEEDVTVERRGTETFVSIRYVEQIPLLPRLYTHEQLYDITIAVEPIRPLTVDDRR
jgi:hypothetical protein